MPFPTDRLILVSQGIDNNGNTTVPTERDQKSVTLSLALVCFAQLTTKVFKTVTDDCDFS